MQHRVRDEIERPLPEPISIEEIEDTPAPVEARVEARVEADPTLAADEAEIKV
jgi:hypothetical protein